MELAIESRYEGMDEGLYEIIRRVIFTALQMEGFPPAAEVSVLFVDDDEIQRLNRKFRNKNQPTDVLSFPMLNFNRGERPPGDTAYMLGDIVISMDTALRQAREYGHSIEREIGFLAAHSMLHLMGYDHESTEEEAEMIGKQEEILAAVRLSR